MRSLAYVTLLGVFLLGLLAFATVPALAQGNEDLMMMQKGGQTTQHKGPVATPRQKSFTGEAKTGSSQQATTTNHMKSMMKGQSIGKLNKQSKAQGAVGAQSAKVTAQAKGGEATIARASRSATCLRVYSKPSFSSQEMACMPKGETVHLNGVFSKDRHWAQLNNNGWVVFRDLKTGVKPPRVAARTGSWGRTAGAGGHPVGWWHHRYYDYYPGYFGGGGGYYYPYYYSYYYPGYFGGCGY